MNYSLIIPHYNSTVLLRRVLDSVGRNLNVQTIVLENCRQTQIGIPFPYGHLVQKYSSIIEEKLAYGPLQNYLSMKEIKKVIR